MWFAVCAALVAQCGCGSPWRSKKLQPTLAPPKPSATEVATVSAHLPQARLPQQPPDNNDARDGRQQDAEGLPPGDNLPPNGKPAREPDVAGNIPVPTLGQRLRIPPSLPGAQAPQLRVPPSEPSSPELRNRVIDLLFPNLPQVWPLTLPRPTPERPAISLAELQELAVQYNPTLIQARANVTSMLGDAIQAGTHPNPIVGYEADTVGSSGTRNYQGLYFTQQIITANKLGLARNVYNVDVMNAQLAVRRTRLQVLADVKASYFSLLVAQENLIVSNALVHFMEEVYRLQRSRLKAGQAAPFEAGQLRGLAEMAKVQLNLAQNSYVASWKSLAARLGLPQMPLSPVQGRADMPVPVVQYDAALKRMLSVHPDILIGQNMESKARIALKLEQVKPVPDVYLYGTFQKDFTTPGVRSTTYNTQLGVPIPIWNRNRGGILSARGDLVQAAQQWRVAQVDLTARLANAFSQYQTNRYQVEQLLNHILPDYARAYRGVYEQHQAVPEVMGFEGIIVAQGNLASAVTAYIAALNLQWAAVADLSYLMQAETLEEMSVYGGGRPAPVTAEPVPAPAPNRRPAAPQQGGRR
ncbi:MAG TPA: TolC family protein [Pirellulales bacterium]|nr:TolC family protein [Pirellulales bacterium]